MWSPSILGLSQTPPIPPQEAFCKKNQIFLTISMLINKMNVPTFDKEFWAHRASYPRQQG